MCLLLMLSSLSFFRQFTVSIEAMKKKEIWNLNANSNVNTEEEKNCVRVSIIISSNEYEMRRRHLLTILISMHLALIYCTKTNYTDTHEHTNTRSQMKSSSMILLMLIFQNHHIVCKFTCTNAIYDRVQWTLTRITISMWNWISKTLMMNFIPYWWMYYEYSTLNTVNILINSMLNSLYLKCIFNILILNLCVHVCVLGLFKCGS